MTAGEPQPCASRSRLRPPPLPARRPLALPLSACKPSSCAVTNGCSNGGQGSSEAGDLPRQGQPTAAASPPIVSPASTVHYPLGNVSKREPGSMMRARPAVHSEKWANVRAARRPKPRVPAAFSTRATPSARAAERRRRVGACVESGVRCRPNDLLDRDLEASDDAGVAACRE